MAMTQTRTQDETVQRVQVRYRENDPCYNVGYDDWQDLVVKRVVKVSNDRDTSRRKPDDLMASPTLMRRQTTETWIPGFSKQSGTSTYICWPGPKSGTVKWHNHLYKWPAYTMIEDATDPYWKTKFRLKIKEQKVNLGASLAEYRQTMDMIGNLGDGLLKILRDVRKGRVKGLARRTNLRSIASANLMYRFGILPLISDVHKSLEALAAPAREPSIIVRATGKSEHDSERDLYSSRSEKVSSAVAKVNFRKPDLPKFTLGNPIELGWELLPFSWVIDYFFTIGDTISALDALVDVTTIQGSVTHRHKRVILGPEVKPGSQYNEVTVKLGSYTYESIHRDLFDQNGIAERPHWEPSLSFTRVGNLLSALVVLRK